MIRAANVSPPSPLWGEGSWREVRGNPYSVLSLQLSRFQEGRGFFTGGEGRSQKRPQVNSPSPPAPLPKRGEGSETFAARINDGFSVDPPAFVVSEIAVILPPRWLTAFVHSL